MNPNKIKNPQNVLAQISGILKKAGYGSVPEMGIESIDILARIRLLLLDKEALKRQNKKLRQIIKERRE